MAVHPVVGCCQAPKRETVFWLRLEESTLKEGQAWASPKRRREGMMETEDEEGGKARCGAFRTQFGRNRASSWVSMTVCLGQILEGPEGAVTRK